MLNAYVGVWNMSFREEDVKVAVLIMQRRQALKYSEHFVHPEILCSLNPSAQSVLPVPCLISRRFCAYGPAVTSWRGAWKSCSL